MVFSSPTPAHPLLLSPFGSCLCPTAWYHKPMTSAKNYNGNHVSTFPAIQSSGWHHVEHPSQPPVRCVVCFREGTQKGKRNTRDGLAIQERRKANCGKLLCGPGIPSPLCPLSYNSLTLSLSIVNFSILSN